MKTTASCADYKFQMRHTVFTNIEICLLYCFVCSTFYYFYKFIINFFALNFVPLYNIAHRFHNNTDSHDNPKNVLSVSKLTILPKMQTKLSDNQTVVHIFLQKFFFLKYKTLK